MRRWLVGLLLPLACLLFGEVSATERPSPLAYQLDMHDPAQHHFDVRLDYRSGEADTVLVMPVWTPGYYQRMPYADQVSDFHATDATGRSLPWRREGDRWLIDNPSRGELVVRYRVDAEHDFVAANYLDRNKGYVSPAGVFMYPEGGLCQKIALSISPPHAWEAASGLDRLPGPGWRYQAKDFDTLYDSPILLGHLQHLPTFQVRGVPHEVVGVDFTGIDGIKLVEDLKKVVQAATDMMGDIPYQRYIFLAIGPTRGGIEHLNSAAVGLGTQENGSDAGRLRLDHFLAHEYFHNFNVKRIRPLELGPFDYTRENRSSQLWISEGLTVYYEDILLRRAGLIGKDVLLADRSAQISKVQNAPGHRYQSLIQASYETWEDGPFGRVEDPFNQTISYYEKGPVVGFLLDLAIRHASGNRHSLDDVMRGLYHEYYQKLGRGFTDAEFQQLCEQLAGHPLTELFTYVDTTVEPDYRAYLKFAALGVDTAERDLPGGWSGIRTEQLDQGRWRVIDVDWQSPAWLAGVRKLMGIVSVNGKPMVGGLVPLDPATEPGQTLRLTVQHDGQEQELSLQYATKRERPYTLNAISGAEPLEQAILQSF